MLLTLPIQINIKLLKRMEKTKMSKILNESRWGYLTKQVQSAKLNKEIEKSLIGLINRYYIDGEECDERYNDSCYIFAYSTRYCNTLAALTDDTVFDIMYEQYVVYEIKLKTLVDYICDNYGKNSMKESEKMNRKSIKESNKRKNLKESLSFKESELKVNVTFVYNEDNRSPSVRSEIATDYLYDLDDFKEVCDYLSESQNGYYSIEESRSTDGEYKICFYTIDDSDDMDGTLTGYVIFNVVLNHSKEIEKFFDAI